VATKTQRKTKKANPKPDADGALSRIAAAEADSDAQVRGIHDAAGKAHDRLDAKAMGLLKRVAGAKGEERIAVMRAYLACRRDQARYQVCRHVAREMLRGSA
jgi:hypothetical protein